MAVVINAIRVQRSVVGEPSEAVALNLSRQQIAASVRPCRFLYALGGGHGFPDQIDL